jgi:exonuclease SbcC
MEKDEEDKILAEVEEFKNEINDYESKLNELSGKIGYIPKDPKEELDELNNVKERFDSLMKLSSQVEELVNEKKEKEREIKNCERKRKKILDKIKEIDFNKEEFDKVNCNLNEVNRKLSELEGRINEKHNQKKRIEDDIKSIRESIKKLKKELIKAEKFKKFTSELENIRRSFSRDGIQKLLRQIAAPKITEFAGIYLEKFNLDITDIIVSENFDISVIKRGEMIPLSSLSGGEKVAVAIALRFAIAKAVSGKVLTIIMDEPTTHLDEDRRRELVDIMKGFFKEDESIPYVIIVTHHQELEDVADTIYRVNKVEGVSIVTTDV